MKHEGICTFSGDRYGLVLCDQGAHEVSFCTICGRSLPSYLATCYECQEAERATPYLDESLAALRRSLVLETKKKIMAVVTAGEEI